MIIEKNATTSPNLLLEDKTKEVAVEDKKKPDVDLSKVENKLEEWFVKGYHFYMLDEEKRELERLRRIKESRYNATYTPKRVSWDRDSEYVPKGIDETNLNLDEMKTLLDIWGRGGDIPNSTSLTKQDLIPYIGEEKINELLDNNSLWKGDDGMIGSCRGDMCLCHNCFGVFFDLNEQYQDKEKYTYIYLGKPFKFCSFQCMKTFNNIYLSYCERRA